MLTRLQPFFDERFVFATLTQLKKTSTAPYKKVQIRPFLQGGELTFQLTYVYDKKVLHENLSAPEAAEAVAGLLENLAREHLAAYREDIEQWRKI